MAEDPTWDCVAEAADLVHRAAALDFPHLRSLSARVTSESNGDCISGILFADFVSPEFLAVPEAI